MDRKSGPAYLLATTTVGGRTGPEGLVVAAQVVRVVTRSKWSGVAIG